MKCCWFPASLTLALLLVACGGGGGGGGGNPAPVPEPAPIPPVEETPTEFSMAGTIAVSSNLDVDGDTNSQGDLPAGNNTFSAAQTISNPTTLGGYVSQPGEGEFGAVQRLGDLDDYYRVEMLAGQTITLLVADFEQADADLYLYQPNGVILDSSIETGELEFLTVPVDGTYIIDVFAFAGATNYVLAIGSTQAAAGTAPAQTPTSLATSEIIPWQAIMEYREPESKERSGVSQRDLEGRMGMRRRAGSRNRKQLMALEPSPISSLQHVNRLGRAREKLSQMKSPQLQARWQTLMTIKNLRREPGIVSAEPNYRVHTMATPDDEAYPFQWHYPLINLPAAWDLTTGDPSVIVAVIDTGILQGHPDLAGQLVPGYDFISNPQRARDGNGIDPDPEDVGDGGELGNSSFHGTHVGGTIAAASNNETGVSGVAWNVRLMPLRVLGLDGGSTYDVGQAVLYAAGLPNDSGTVPAQRADIINLSLGGAGFSQTQQTLFNDVREAGLLVVAAAGNEASSRPNYPAAYDGVISVSAVDFQRQRAAYSNFGSRIDVAAPGGNNGADINGDGYPDGVLSTGGSASESGAINYVYSFLNGTSMASPHVAGVLALMKSVNNELSPADIDALLSQGELTDELGDPGRDDFFGNGLINAQRAVAAALVAAGNPPADNPQLRASSSLLNFGSAGLSLDLVLQNSGRGELTLLEVGSSESWLGISAASIDESGLGTYRVEVDRENLAFGVYSATITADSSVNTLTVDVLMSVVDEATGGDVGLVYVLLVDRETQEVAAQFEASPDAGSYSYQFNDIPAGDYELFAGTDSDNDLFICDAGEACGAFLTLDQPAVIELLSDLEKVEFPVEYRVVIPDLSSQSESTKQQNNIGIRRLGN